MKTVGTIKFQRGHIDECQTDQSLRDQHTPQKGRKAQSTSTFLRHGNISCGGSVLGRIVCQRSTDGMDTFDKTEVTDGE